MFNHLKNNNNNRGYFDSVVIYLPGEWILCQLGSNFQMNAQICVVDLTQKYKHKQDSVLFDNKVVIIFYSNLSLL